MRQRAQHFLLTAGFTWGLGLFTLTALLAHRPNFDQVGTLGVFFVGLTVLMFALGTLLDGIIVSPAPTTALMAYFTLGRQHAAPAALWSVAIGALLGYSIWFVRVRPPLERPPIVRQCIVGTSQLVLGLFIGGWVYEQVGGTLPLRHLNSSDLGPVLAFTATYLIIYLDIYLLEAYLYRERTPHLLLQHWQEVTSIILMPLPLAILGAMTYHELSALAFGLLIVGLLILVAGVYTINRTQARFRQQVLELSALSSVSHAMRTNLDLNALLEVIYQQVKHLLDAANFTVVLYDPNRSTLYFPLHVEQHRPTPLEPRDVGQGLIEYVIQQKTPLLITEYVPQQARALGLTPPPIPIYSWLGVPLLAPDRVLGCLVVYSTRPTQHFDEEDLRRLTTIAGQAGIAIDNAQLYGQARDRAVQFATLNNIAAILSGTLNAQHILDLVGSSAVAVAACDAVALYMWWEGIERLPVLARHNGLSKNFTTAPPRPLMLDINDLQRRRQPVIVTDVQIDQRARTVRAVMAAEGKRSWIELLLRKGDELLGILILYYNQPRTFNVEEIELLRNFTNQAALAISNARLYTQTDEALNRRVEQLSALADISRELTSTLNLPGLFRLVLDRALETTQSRTGVLLLRTEDSEGPPSLVAYRGFAADAFDDSSPLSGYVEETYRTGQPTLVGDLAQDARQGPPFTGIRAQLNVPILHDDEVLGVISLGSDRPNDYSPDDLAFVAQLATQARIAIDNARLFRRIEDARDRLQVILDSMKEGVILIGADGVIMLANPRVHDLLGLNPQQIINVPITDLVAIPSLDLAGRLGFSTSALLNLIQNLSERWWDESTDGAGRVTFEVNTPKLRFVDRTDAPIRDDAGHVIGLLMVFSDVTEERQLIQAREDLSSMIVHDLRGPLTAIMTSLKLLGELSPPDDSLGRMIRETADMSSRAARKLLNLVNSLLDVSKLESGVINLEREPIQLENLCAAVMDEMMPLAQELDVLLHLTLPRDLPILYIDAEKIERVLLNLVDNAIKFTPSESHVTIRACPPDETSPGFVRVEVADTGPGVPDEHKERLFDRFTQIEGQRGRRRGTGLGLTFCKLAVEAHGGNIWVEDNPAGGAIFVFTLPVMDMRRWELEE